MGFFKRLIKPKTNVSLTIPKTTMELGEDLKGVIKIACQEEYDANEIRAELRCVEKVRRERWVYNERSRRRIRQVYWDAATLHSDNPKAASEMHLIPGFEKAFPFKVNIPAGGRESVDGLDANVKWSIKGVVAIKGRPDVTSEVAELQVIRATSPVRREMEVVMIPCEYCGGLMPQTSTACPHCGAPRKATAQF